MTDGTGVPHLDDTVTARNLHERCEQVAVPDFDWLNQPILAVMDGLLHITPETAPTPGHRARHGHG